MTAKAKTTPKFEAPKSDPPKTIVDQVPWLFHEKLIESGQWKVGEHEDGRSDRDSLVCEYDHYAIKYTRYLSGWSAHVLVTIKFGDMPAVSVVYGIDADAAFKTFWQRAEDRAFTTRNERQDANRLSAINGLKGVLGVK